MWIRSVPSHSAAWAPHLFPTPGRGGVFPPSSTPEGVCVGARPSPTRAWSPHHPPSRTAGVRRIHGALDARSMRLCARAPHPLAHPAAHSRAQSTRVASTAGTRDDHARRRDLPKATPATRGAPTIPSSGKGSPCSFLRSSFLVLRSSFLVFRSLFFVLCSSCFVLHVSRQFICACDYGCCVVNPRCNALSEFEYAGDSGCLCNSHSLLTFAPFTFHFVVS